MFNNTQLRYLTSLGLQLCPSHYEQFRFLLIQLQQWNHTFNLTAISEAKHVISHHFLDSLSVLPYLHDDAIIDVGCGAGFPGLPLAICQPTKHFTLCDSNRKKTAFVRQVSSELGLTNVTVIHDRVENLPARDYSCVLARAFADLATFLELTRHLVRLGARFVAMKGQYPTNELSQLPAGINPEVVKLTIPGLNEQRHIVLFNLT